jgi:hypothetical protein
VGQFRSPPLLAASGERATTPEAKMKVLRETHLPADRATSDTLPPLTPPLGTPWPKVSPDKVDNAFLGASSTAPGDDEIPLSAIKLAWPQIGPIVRDFFSLCLSHGWHPNPFRSAVYCAIEKPGKRDRSSPRSFRLISLLSIVEKALSALWPAASPAWQLTNRSFSGDTSEHYQLEPQAISPNS